MYKDISSNFESVFKRLENSLIKIVDKDCNKVLSVINPSVNDFLNKRITKESVEYRLLMKTSKSLKQLKRLLSENEYREKLANIFSENTIRNYIFKNERQQSNFIALYVLQNGVKNLNYKVDLINVLNEVIDLKYIGSLYNKKEQIIDLSLRKDTCEFYNLGTYFSDWKNISDIISKFNIISAFDFVVKICDVITISEELVDDLSDLLKTKIELYCSNVDIYDYNFDTMVEDFIFNNSSYSDCISDDMPQAQIEAISIEANNMLKQEVENIIEESIENLPDCFNKFSLKGCIDNINIDGLDSFVESLIKSTYDDDYDEDDNDVVVDGSYDEIDYLFNR